MAANGCNERNGVVSDDRLSFARRRESVIRLPNGDSYGHPFNPTRSTQISWHPRAFLYRNFLTDAECDHLIQLAKDKLEKSMVANNDSGKSIESEVRTSSGMLLIKALTFIIPLKKMRPNTVLLWISCIQLNQVVCEFDWRFDTLEDFTDELIYTEELPEDHKDAFQAFVNEKVQEGKKANREAREKRNKAQKEMSKEVAAFESMRFYKFYPVASPDTPVVSNVKMMKKKFPKHNPLFGFDNDTETLNKFKKHFDILSRNGATLIENLEIIKFNQIISMFNGETIALLAEFKIALNAYLKELVASPVRSLADVISFNKKFADLEMIKEYPQDLFLAAENTTGIGKLEKEALRNLTKASKYGFEKLMKENKLDALVTPYSDGSTVLAIGGYPGISIPAGYDKNGAPYGICFGGLKGSEPTLIEIAYGFEQATKFRKPPPIKEQL